MITNWIHEQPDTRNMNEDFGTKINYIYSDEWWRPNSKRGWYKLEETSTTTDTEIYASRERIIIRWNAAEFLCQISSTPYRVRNSNNVYYRDQGGDKLRRDKFFDLME